MLMSWLLSNKDLEEDGTFLHENAAVLFGEPSPKSKAL